LSDLKVLRKVVAPAIRSNAYQENSMVEQKKTPDLTPKNRDQFKAGVDKGKEVIKAGGTKVAAAEAIYEHVKAETRDVICVAFVAGAGLTEKGAPTYFYNIKRKEARKKAAKT
jgi:hypothetical protein